MTTTESPTVDNGVNVAALLGARDAMTDMPELAAFQWRATSTWVDGVPTRTAVEQFHGVGDEQSHRQTSRSTPTIRRSSRPRTTASPRSRYVLVGLAGCLTAGIAAVAPEPRDPAAFGAGDGRGRHGPATASWASTPTCATVSTASR